MKLSPIEIQQQQFRSQLRGFDRQEVRHFLDVVAQEMTEFVRENSDLKAETRRALRQLEELKEREESLKDAMLTAQRALDDLREHAQKEAELLINEAELRAEKILHNANNKVTRMQEELNDLRRQRVRFLEEVRGVVNTHARLLDVHVADVKEAPEASVTVLERLRPPAPPTADDVAANIV
jgi:cell division initiation protein